MSNQKKNQEIEPVNVHSYEARKEAGLLWYNGTFRRNPSIWTKSDKEKKALKRAKHSYHGKFYSSWGYSKPSIPCYGKLIIRLYEGIDGHNTLSIKCGQSDIPEIINRHNGNNKNVQWYKWLGKVYNPTELPFYYW